MNEIELTTYRITLEVRCDSNPRWITDAIEDNLNPQYEWVSITDMVELDTETVSVE